MATGTVVHPDVLTDPQSPLADHTVYNRNHNITIKLDDLDAPDDNTDLNASITKHGLLPKLPNNAALFLDGVGGFTSPGVEALPLDTISSYGSGDSFAGTSLDGGWSDLQTTAVTLKDRTVSGWLTLRNTSHTSGAERGIKRTFSPAGDFEVRTKLGFGRLARSFRKVGLFVGATDPSDAASARRLSFSLAFNTNGEAIKFATWLSGAETNIIAGTTILSNFEMARWSWPVWMRIKRVGSTLSCGLSFDGVSFEDAATTGTIAFTVDTVGLFIEGSSATQDMAGAFDWIQTL